MSDRMDSGSNPLKRSSSTCTTNWRANAFRITIRGCQPHGPNNSQCYGNHELGNKQSSPQQC